jgi:hypothetical protein
MPEKRRPIFKFQIKPKVKPNPTTKSPGEKAVHCQQQGCGGAMLHHPFVPPPPTPQQIKEFGQFRWFHTPPPNLFKVWSCDRCGYTIHGTKQPTEELLRNFINQTAPASWKTTGL